MKCGSLLWVFIAFLSVTIKLYVGFGRVILEYCTGQTYYIKLLTPCRLGINQVDCEGEVKKQMILTTPAG
eukprot:6479266-Amphidinium_carterae.2